MTGVGYDFVSFYVILNIKLACSPKQNCH